MFLKVVSLVVLLTLQIVVNADEYICNNEFVTTSLNLSQPTIHINGCNYNDTEYIALQVGAMVADAHETMNTPAVAITIDNATFTQSPLVINAFDDTAVDPLFMDNTPFLLVITNSRFSYEGDAAAATLFSLHGAFPHRSNITLRGNTWRMISYAVSPDVHDIICGSVWSSSVLTLSRNTSFVLEENVVVAEGHTDDCGIALWYWDWTKPYSYRFLLNSGSQFSWRHNTLQVSGTHNGNVHVWHQQAPLFIQTNSLFEWSDNNIVALATADHSFVYVWLDRSTETTLKSNGKLIWRGNNITASAKSTHCTIWEQTPEFTITDFSQFVWQSNILRCTVQSSTTYSATIWRQYDQLFVTFDAVFRWLNNTIDVSGTSSYSNTTRGTAQVWLQPRTKPHPQSFTSIRYRSLYTWENNKMTVLAQGPAYLWYQEFDSPFPLFIDHSGSYSWIRNNVSVTSSAYRAYVWYHPSLYASFLIQFDSFYLWQENAFSVIGHAGSTIWTEFQMTVQYKSKFSWIKNTVTRGGDGTVRKEAPAVYQELLLWDQSEGGFFTVSSGSTYLWQDNNMSCSGAAWRQNSPFTLFDESFFIWQGNSFAVTPLLIAPASPHHQHFGVLISATSSYTVTVSSTVSIEGNNITVQPQRFPVLTPSITIITTKTAGVATATTTTPTTQNPPVPYALWYFAKGTSSVQPSIIIEVSTLEFIKNNIYFLQYDNEDRSSRYIQSLYPISLSLLWNVDTTRLVLASGNVTFGGNIINTPPSASNSGNSGNSYPNALTTKLQYLWRSESSITRVAAPFTLRVCKNKWNGVPEDINNQATNVTLVSPTLANHITLKQTDDDSECFPGKGDGNNGGKTGGRSSYEYSVVREWIIGGSVGGVLLLATAAAVVGYWYLYIRNSQRYHGKHTQLPLTEVAMQEVLSTENQDDTQTLYTRERMD